MYKEMTDFNKVPPPTELSHADRIFISVHWIFVILFCFFAFVATMLNIGTPVEHRGATPLRSIIAGCVIFALLITSRVLISASCRRQHALNMRNDAYSNGLYWAGQGIMWIGIGAVVTYAMLQIDFSDSVKPVDK